MICAYIFLYFIFYYLNITIYIIIINNFKVTIYNIIKNTFILYYKFIKTNNNYIQKYVIFFIKIIKQNIVLV